MLNMASFYNSCRIFSQARYWQKIKIFKIRVLANFKAVVNVFKCCIKFMMLTFLIALELFTLKHVEQNTRSVISIFCC